MSVVDRSAIADNHAAYAEWFGCFDDNANYRNDRTDSGQMTSVSYGQFH